MADKKSREREKTIAIMAVEITVDQQNQRVYLPKDIFQPELSPIDCIPDQKSVRVKMAEFVQINFSSSWPWRDVCAFVDKESEKLLSEYVIDRVLKMAAAKDKTAFAAGIKEGLREGKYTCREETKLLILELARAAAWTDLVWEALLEDKGANHGG